jgi:hypothetical protein
MFLREAADAVTSSPTIGVLDKYKLDQVINVLC